MFGRRLDLGRAQLGGAELEEEVGLQLGRWRLGERAPEVCDRDILGAPATCAVGGLPQDPRGVRVSARLAAQQVDSDPVGRCAGGEEQVDRASMPRRSLARVSSAYTLALTSGWTKASGRRGSRRPAEASRSAAS